MGKKLIVTNAFSLQMIDESKTIRFTRLEDCEALALYDNHYYKKSAIGHEDLANVLSQRFDRQIEFNRINVRLEDEAVLLVAQLVGGRLPLGTTELPEDCSLSFYKVEIETDWIVCTGNSDGGDISSYDYSGTYDEAMDFGYGHVPPYEGIEPFVTVQTKGSSENPMQGIVWK